MIHIATILAQFQRECIEEAVGHQFKVTYHCNAVHTVLASLNDARYGAHSLTTSGYQKGTRCKQPLVISNSADRCSTDLVYTQTRSGD